jgi:hypothetical protein
MNFWRKTMMPQIATTRRRITTLLSLALLAALLGSLAPWSAQSAAAYQVQSFNLATKGGVYGQYGWQWTDLAKANGTYWKGNDGRGNIMGHLCDSVADGRSAYLKIEFGRTLYRDGRTETVQVSGGCTYFTFNSQYTQADLTIGTCGSSGWCSLEPRQTIYFR